MIPSFDMNVFYERLQALCKEKGISISRFTTGVLKLSSGAATQWKNGVVPSASIIASIANYFDVSSDYILGLSDEPSRASDYDPDNLEYLYDYLIKQIDASNPEAELLLFHLYKRYLDHQILGLEQARDITIKSVFDYTVKEKEAAERVRNIMIKRGEALINNANKT